MNLQEAKEFLNTCVRNELRDHAFGDTEVGWTLNGAEVAAGYFGGGTADVCINYDTVNVAFSAAEARELRDCGTIGISERNDETGPEEYQEGVVMPGMTLEGVQDELTREK
jgi:hypothetical protein